MKLIFQLSGDRKLEKKYNPRYKLKNFFKMKGKIFIIPNRIKKKII